MSSFWSPSRGPTSQIVIRTARGAYSPASNCMQRLRDRLAFRRAVSGWVCKMADREASVTNAVRVRDELREAILDRRAGARRAAARRGARRALRHLAHAGARGAAPARRARASSRSSRTAARSCARSTPPTSLDLYERPRADRAVRRARGPPTRIGRDGARRGSRSSATAPTRAAPPTTRAVDDQIALNEEFHRIIVAAAGSRRGSRPRCARSPASRARSAPRSGATTRSARSRCSATASSSARCERRQPRLAEAVDAHAHPRGGRVPHGGDP